MSIRQLVNIVLASHSINYKRFLTYFYMIQSPKRGNNCIHPFWARQQGEHFFSFECHSQRYTRTWGDQQSGDINVEFLLVLSISV